MYREDEWLVPGSDGMEQKSNVSLENWLSTEGDI